MKQYKQSAFIILAMLSISFLSAKADAEKIVDKVAAVINDDIITLYELNTALKPYEEKIKEDNPPNPDQVLHETRSRLLNLLIEKKLINQEAARSNISVDEKKLDDSIAEFRKHNKLDDFEFKKFLNNQGVTLEEYRDQVKEYMLRNLLLNYQVRSKIVITKDEISDYYKENISRYTETAMCHLYNIFMHVSDLGNYIEREMVLERMIEVLNKLKNGESFTKMAVEYSEALNASTGGELGKMPFNSLSDVIKDTISKIEPGEFTPIIETEEGFQIFYLKDREKTEAKTLEEAYSLIEEELYKKHLAGKFGTWIEDLKKRAYIKIMLEDL